MAARSRLHPETRNHEKKDGFVPARPHTQSALGSWKSFRRRRVILAIVAVGVLYLFFKNIPTDVPPVNQRYDSRFGRLHPGLQHQSAWESQEQIKDGKDHNYEGPIAFLHLAKTLRGTATTRDSKGSVLFAISRLESIPRILPIACSMAQYNRTRVHVAFMGRQTANWADIKTLNGISDDACDVFLHDARPDFPALSSATRMDVSARASLGHIHTVAHLQAVLVGDDNQEDVYFVRALKEKTASMGLSLITLPAAGLGSLSWISSLDGAALNHFSKIHVDIVIQARPESSASLIRLLRSMKEADYSGWSPPRLTIELPASVDPFLTDYLARFKWPVDASSSESRLVIRHRTDASLLSPPQASLRTVESFYPLVPGDSHVLLLSPEAELSTGYFHLLMYTLLEYKYAARRTDLVNHLLGISLDLPPYAPDLQTEAPWTSSRLQEPLILWQVPNSNAALYFGDRWMELHTFLSRRLSVDPELSKRSTATPSIAHEFPAWLKPMLEMMQARDYWMMYPNFVATQGSSAVTMHHELPESPEEYLVDDQKKEQPSSFDEVHLTEDQTLTANDEIERLMRKEHRTYSTSLVTPLLELMPLELRQSTLGDAVPLISYKGEKISWEDSGSLSWQFAKDFAETVGGCASYDPMKVGSGNVESLFCLAAG
ncbi:hypothetical protein PV05_00426 [Exophiala xenobiotica]|uniref:Glycosyltransferase 2 n=1 Tax=Exophiala xenobiotica TaxID=348802 RepID=A0A0D2EZS5_9EURO|nr:uncharacterized protein PV05_00426 [Exophiala xenobiotica]KIW60190.1 hypothetical protein PV05_00426 [Exophiala xenobiotica]